MAPARSADSSETQLAHAGEDVTFIARGATLEALKTRGIRVIMSDGSEKAVPSVKATADYSAAGPQDLVVLAMKAHQLEAVAADVPKLLGPGTVVVPMQNGIPFWYFHKHGGALEGSTVTSVDPSGAIQKNIPCERVIGCVVYPATELLAPGVIKQIEGNRFPVGDLDGTESERVKRVCGVLHPRRPAVAGADRHPCRDVAQALGQHDLQPDQRAVPRDAGRDLSISAHARACACHDDRGPGDCRQARYLVPGTHREAHRGCGTSRSPQDLHAAGCGGRTRRSRPTRCSAP